jgi:bifunctional DNA-binding transcriptional regulator/antitoxin component of YhaV-PrlF toxin-antitoxin module
MEGIEMPVITIPKALRERLGDEAVESFVLLLKEIEHEGRKDALVLAEERFERRLSEEVTSLKVYISDVKSELEAKIANLEIKIGDVKSELEAKIANMKADLIKWMFLFGAGQIVVLIAILQVFFRK